MDTRLYWIWLANTLPPGDPLMNALLEHFPTAEAIYTASAEQLRPLGATERLIARFQNRSLDGARRILERTLRAGAWVLTPEDSLYPFSLRRIVGCPAVLYCRGVMPDVDTRPAIALVGTRHSSAEGVRDARAMAAGLAAAGMVVVSGGAKGIDAAAHTGALEAGGVTVAVLACPLDISYPRENEDLRRRIVAQGGLLVSEYPIGEPYQCVFPIRNRLMVGLSQGVCLAQTPVRSGARITARLAREEGRDVFAMPGSLSGHHNDGAHREIQAGAALVTRATDILDFYAPQYPGMLDPEAADRAQTCAESAAESTGKAANGSAARAKKPTGSRIRAAQPNPSSPFAPPESRTGAALPPEASDAAKTVYAALDAEPLAVDDLAATTGLTVPCLLAALTELELFGCARCLSGQHYVKS